MKRIKGGMGMRVRVIIIFSIIVFAIGLSAFFLHTYKSFRIVDANTTTLINEKLKPVGVTSVFPAGTATVNCWFQWSNAMPKTKIIASWRYVTDDIRILDYAFDLPRKAGSGGVSLSMPEGKELPAGTYQVELKKDKRTLKAVTFRVLERT